MSFLFVLSSNNAHCYSEKCNCFQHFEIHLFTQRTAECLKYNYYKRWKHSLILKKITQCIKIFWTEWYLNVYFVFHLLPAFIKLQKVFMFLRRQNNNLPWKKSFTPSTLSIMFSSWASVNVYTFCNYESLNCEKMDQIHKEIFRRESTQCSGTGGFLWTVSILIAQDKKGTHEQISQNKKTFL